MFPHLVPNIFHPIPPETPLVYGVSRYPSSTFSVLHSSLLSTTMTHGTVLASWLPYEIFPSAPWAFIYHKGRWSSVLPPLCHHVSCPTTCVDVLIWPCAVSVVILGDCQSTVIISTLYLTMSTRKRALKNSPPNILLQWRVIDLWISCSLENVQWK